MQYLEVTIDIKSHGWKVIPGERWQGALSSALLGMFLSFKYIISGTISLSNHS